MQRIIVCSLLLSLGVVIGFFVRPIIKQPDMTATLSNHSAILNSAAVSTDRVSLSLQEGEEGLATASDVRNISIQLTTLEAMVSTEMKAIHRGLSQLEASPEDQAQPMDEQMVGNTEEYEILYDKVKGNLDTIMMSGRYDSDSAMKLQLQLIKLNPQDIRDVRLRLVKALNKGEIVWTGKGIPLL
jgi:hypothetical protein